MLLSPCFLTPHTKICFFLAERWWFWWCGHSTSFSEQMQLCIGSHPLLPGQPIYPVHWAVSPESLIHQWLFQFVPPRNVSSILPPRVCSQHKVRAEDDDTCGVSGRSQERTQPRLVETGDSSNLHSTKKKSSRLLLGLAHL